MFDAFEAGRKYSVEEYLRLEEISDIKHEFLDGDGYPVGSPPPPKPRANAVEVFTALTVRVRRLVERRGLSVQVKVGPAIHGSTIFVRRTPDGDFPSTSDAELTEPTSVILTTCDMDYVDTYHREFLKYLDANSILEIVWIHANRQRFEVYKRTPDRGWIVRSIDSSDFNAELKSVGVTITLEEVYRGMSVAKEKCNT